MAEETPKPPGLVCIPAPLRLLKGSAESLQSEFVISVVASSSSSDGGKSEEKAANEERTSPDGAGCTESPSASETAEGRDFASHSAPSPEDSGAASSRQRSLAVKEASDGAASSSHCSVAVQEASKRSVSQAGREGMHRSESGQSLEEKNKEESMSAADALFIAVSIHNNLERVHELLESGHDVNARASGGMHVLFRAIHRARDPALVARLLEASAEVNAIDKHGQGVMHYWAITRKMPPFCVKQLAQLLVESRASVNVQRSDGLTPLHLVAKECQESRRNAWLPFHRARWLFANGAVAHVRSNDGQLPHELIRPDSRLSKQALRLCLMNPPDADTPREQWPTCDRRGCDWCNA